MLPKRPGFRGEAFGQGLPATIENGAARRRDFHIALLLLLSGPQEIVMVDHLEPH